MPSSSLRNIAINLYSKMRNIIIYIAGRTLANNGIISSEQFVEIYLLDIYEQSGGFFGTSGQQTSKSTALFIESIFSSFFKIFQNIFRIIVQLL